MSIHAPIPHPTNNLCQTLTGRAHAEAHAKALTAARGAMTNRTISTAQLCNAFDILSQSGTVADTARADLIRARLRRMRGIATATNVQGGAA